MLMRSNRVLRFRITEADYQRLCRAAQDDRLTISTLIRYAVADWLELDGGPCPACTSLCARSQACPTDAARGR